MKKLFGFIGLFALLILPLKVNAASTLDYTVSAPDANGVYTVELYLKVDSGEQYNQPFNLSIKGQHAIIRETFGSEEFEKSTEQSTISSDGFSATLITQYRNGIYTGTGEKILVGSFTYVHDSTYQGEEKCMVSVSLDGGTDSQIVEKEVENSKTGSFLSAVGVITGIILVGAAYYISKKSTKLYKV